MRIIDPFDCGSPRRYIDVPKLQASLIARGVWAAKESVLDAWSRYSESHAAGWLSPYDDDGKTISEHAVDRLLSELEDMASEGES